MVEHLFFDLTNIYWVSFLCQVLCLVLMRLDRQIAYLWSLTLHVRINIKQINRCTKERSDNSAMQIIEIEWFERWPRDVYLRRKCLRHQPCIHQGQGMADKETNQQVRGHYSWNKHGVFKELKEGHYCWCTEDKKREWHKMRSLVV